MDLTTAIGVANEPRMIADEPYVTALNHIVEQRYGLNQRVYIGLPKNHEGEEGRWDRIIKGSVARCDCKRSRVILPGNPRTVYRPNESGLIVLSPGPRTYVKPRGGHPYSTFGELGISGISFWRYRDPFAPVVWNEFDPQTDPLETVEKRLFFAQPEKTPIFKIVSVNPAKKEVGIVLDEGIEEFYPTQKIIGNSFAFNNLCLCSKVTPVQKGFRSE